jgi:hypothetical protein
MPNRHDLIRNASLRDISLMDHPAPAKAGAHRPRQICVQTSPRIYFDACGMAKSIHRPGGCRLAKQATFLLRDRRRPRQRVPPVKPLCGGIHDYCALQYSKRFYKLRPARWWSQHRTADNPLHRGGCREPCRSGGSPATGPLSALERVRWPPGGAQAATHPQAGSTPRTVAALAPMAINIGTENAVTRGTAQNNPNGTRTYPNPMSADSGLQNQNSRGLRSAAAVAFREDELAGRAP